MIKKSLIGFIILFLAYSVFIHFKPDLSASQNQNQDNIIKAEKYLYAKQKHNKVIIGSSLSCCFVPDSIPDFYNLSFGGLSIVDGLQIITASEKYPDVLYVETNVLERQPTDDFLNPILHPINNTLSKTFASLQTDKQPLALIANGMICVLKGTKNTTQLTRKEIPVNNHVLQLQINNASSITDSAIIEHNLSKLHTQLTDLQNLGVKIVLFRMPIHPDVDKQAKNQYIKKRIYETFRKSEFIHLPIKDWDFQTTDGLHLTRNEARVFTSYFKNFDDSIF